MSKLEGVVMMLVLAFFLVVCADNIKRLIGRVKVLEQSCGCGS